MRVASAGSSTDVDGVRTVRRGGIGVVTTVDSGIIEAARLRSRGCQHQVTLELGTNTLETKRVSLPTPPLMVEVLNEMVSPRESLPFWP